MFHWRPCHVLLQRGYDHVNVGSITVESTKRITQTGFVLGSNYFGVDAHAPIWMLFDVLDHGFVSCLPSSLPTSLGPLRSEFDAADRLQQQRRRIPFHSHMVGVQYGDVRDWGWRGATFRGMKSGRQPHLGDKLRSGVLG